MNLSKAGMLSKDTKHYDIFNHTLALFSISCLWHIITSRNVLEYQNLFGAWTQSGFLE